MKLNSIYRKLATLILGISSLNASAALVLAGSGNTVDFYYDDAFWSNVTANVANDRITFAFQSSLQAGATDGNVAYQESPPSSGGAAVVVVAKSGFSFAGMPLGLVAGVAGSYALATSGGTASAYSGASVFEGSFAGGVFSATHLDPLVEVLADAAAVSDDASPFSGAFGVDAIAPAGSDLTGPALGLLDVFYGVFASQDGTGDSSVALDSVSYAISASAMSTVPEPGSLALLFTALGLATWVGRGQKGRIGRSGTAA
ncbi:MAG: PEP-CTERM sorting domain-containing protein [Rhodoferax sp.]|uniref:PEP-CTERM sorting domain-containing protein n=1 Tax=Rhodoferax sp. TaxID=50421 RepID=UPI002603CF5F|nr:PEP-CTERM sorting domain-containing protein [Rhodoferax sp.]MDD2882204.1 PEP-CTERM sorting domain-containing protein [Rhodoferax sp.]